MDDASRAARGMMPGRVAVCAGMPAVGRACAAAPPVLAEAG
jgi:S-adenosylhomocysteine hydrolase